MSQKYKYIIINFGDTRLSDLPERLAILAFLQQYLGVFKSQFEGVAEVVTKSGQLAINRFLQPVSVDICRGHFLINVIHKYQLYGYVAFMKVKSNKVALNDTYTCGRFLSDFKIIALLLILIIVGTAQVHAQDPVLPATNLGLSNVFDGIAGKPGFIFQSFTQAFQTRGYYDQAGMKTPSDVKVNSLLQMNQVIDLTPVRLLGGNLAFTILVPFVQINSSSASGQAPTANPAVFGDPIFGTAVQWSDRRLFGKPFSNRLELDVNVPVGNFNSRYEINPSAHLWNYEVYHALTIMLDKKISVSMRNQLNYNAHYIGSEAKAGAFYNGNYSIDYSFLQAWKVEADTYYLKQINQDSYGGDSHYYQDQFGIYNTKEQVFGYGPGIVYFSPRGIVFEGKVFFETDAQNRFAGTHPTLHIVIPISK
jgi:hypothetical protein